MPGVIRDTTPLRAPAFSFADLEQRAAALLERAHAQAREIITTAQQQATQTLAALRAAAHAAGLAEGRKQGEQQARADAARSAQQEARQQLTQLTDALTAALSDFDATKRNLLATAETRLIELAIRIAGKVCRGCALQSPAAALHNLRETLALVRHERDLIVHVNPAELETLQRVAADTAKSAEQLAHVRLLADERVTPGGCRLEGRTIQVDATFETQLERIAAALLPEAVPAPLQAGSAP